MKFVHLSDLHIGKRVNNFSMIEDQQYILQEIMHIIDCEKPDAVLIAGDVYDRTLPPAEAVIEFDDFLYKLSKRDFDTFIISGNHDSPERLSFGSRIMEGSGIHLSPVFGGAVSPITLKDEFGDVDIYMMPFIKPSVVRTFFKDTEDSIKDYTDAVSAVINSMNVDTSKRNVILSHQFVTGASVSGSEVLSVGGTENVECTVYEPFDYAALGHIHRSQSAGGIKTLRYCGSPLKYSFSDTQDKSVTIVELFEKGSVDIKTIPLYPLRDMRTISDSFENICLNAANDAHRQDYIRVILSDKIEIDNAMSKLRAYYPNIMELSYEKYEEQYNGSSILERDVENRMPIDLIEEFFKSQNAAFDAIEKEIIADILNELEGKGEYASD